MRRIIICAGLLWSAAAFAQNLNPTVEVTNTYAREASGIEKPSQLLAIPDSLTRFNLDFDYAVNEMPYQGAYEFTPYLVEPRPSARLSAEKKLYLRLGAGYTLHPELAVVWTPVKTQKFRLNFFGDHYSYIGDYHNIILSTQGVFEPGGVARKGMELRSRVGADALLNWRSGIFRADVQYNNISASSDILLPAPGSPGASEGNWMHHIFRASTRVQNVPGTTKVDYEVGTQAALISAAAGLQEIHTVTDASLRAQIFRQSIKMGIQAETVTQPDGTAASFHVALPSYVYNGKRFSLKAGVKAAFLLRSDAAFVPSREGHLFPDVQASVALAKDYLTLYMAVTGGNELMSYDSYLQKDSFIDGATWYTDVKVQRVLASLGLRGNIGRRFHFDVKGGYSWIDNMWLWAYNPGSYQPAVSYASPIHSFFAVVDAGWKNQFLSASGYLKYVYTFDNEKTATAGVVPFIPASFSGHAQVFYNWGTRIEAGVTLEGRSYMDSRLGRLPGYLDLGLQGSMRMTSRMGVWLKLGNLLNQPVQRVPFYAEKGVYFTAGIVFNL